MGPTSELVGPATGRVSQAVVRPLPFDLKDQAVKGLDSCTAGIALGVKWVSRVKSAVLLRVVILVVGLSHTQLDGAPDPYASEYATPPPEIGSYAWQKSQQAASERQEQFRIRVAIPDAVGDTAMTDFVARRDANQNKNTVRTKASLAPSALGRILLFLTGLGFTGFLALRKFAPELLAALDQQFNPWALVPATVMNSAAAIRAEDEAFSKFTTAFQTGPPARLPSDTHAIHPVGAVNTLSEFPAQAARLLAAQRKLLEEIARETDPVARQRLLADLRRELGALEGEAGRPEVLLVWQVASAVEGLLKQLTDKVSNVTASTLRTVAGGVDLLADLCAPGLQPDLLTAQPLRFLAVDDDLISRKAISFALKKALTQPDLAENGEAALALATRQAYDVIFLDVQMPGMDGFELCTKIHDTVSNATTPVVFVTVQSDFDAHAKSTLSGGSDLMGKPFLTFEVTVKALTLALRGRLQGRTLTTAADANPNGSKVLSPALAKTSFGSAAQEALPEASTDCARSSQLLGSGGSAAEPAPATPAAAEKDVARAHELLPGELTREFLARASAQLAPMQDLFQAIFQTAGATARQEILAEIYLCLHALDPRTNSATRHPAIQVRAALEGLLRKLLENPNHASPSTLVTLAAGVDLLQDLCGPEIRCDLITQPPMRMLVVDDDPISRRAVACALQMAFEKPETAESGEAALALAAARPFDLIFMDVQMPGMDGFTACAKLHETNLNRTSPVVFVTGQSDFNARTHMSRCGGSDFVGKPFLNSEITVKALTFALRGRLEKQAAWSR